MPTAASKLHSTKTPCYCDECLRATAKAYQRKAEIQAILERLEDLDELGFVLAETRWKR